MVPGMSSAATTLRLVVVLPMRQVVEAGVASLEPRLHRVDGAVAVLADDDLRDVLLLGLLVVDLFAVDEDDEVGVLLDGARLAEVRQLWSLVLAVLQAAVELRQGDDRAVELLGQ